MGLRHDKHESHVIALQATLQHLEVVNDDKRYSKRMGEQRAGHEANLQTQRKAGAPGHCHHIDIAVAILQTTAHTRAHTHYVILALSRTTRYTARKYLLETARSNTAGRVAAWARAASFGTTPTSTGTQT